MGNIYTKLKYKKVDDKISPPLHEDEVKLVNQMALNVYENLKKGITKVLGEELEAFYFLTDVDNVLSPVKALLTSSMVRGFAKLKDHILNKKLDEALCTLIERSLTERILFDLLKFKLIESWVYLEDEGFLCFDQWPDQVQTFTSELTSIKIRVHGKTTKLKLSLHTEIPEESEFLKTKLVKNLCDVIKSLDITLFMHGAFDLHYTKINAIALLKPSLLTQAKKNRTEIDEIVASTLSC